MLQPFTVRRVYTSGGTSVLTDMSLSLLADTGCGREWDILTVQLFTCGVGSRAPMGHFH